MNKIILGDALEKLKELPTAYVDLVFTDAPYPLIKRPYGYWTERQWHEMMQPILLECRRVVKPKGSAVFVFQPTGKPGAMRPWLWEFLLFGLKEWGLVQDAYWLQTAPLSTAYACAGFMRPAVKPCLWFGRPDCYKDQEAVLWEPSQAMQLHVMAERAAKPGRPGL